MVRKLLAVLAMLALAAPFAFGGNLDLTRRMLFTGENTSAAVDTIERFSPWIDIQGAQRVILRTWSAKAAFHASTDADSIYSDSIAVFRVAFTDSMANTNPLIAGDSIIVTSTVQMNADTTTKGVVVLYPPLQEALRGPSNGSGIMTYIMPAAMVTAASQQLTDNNGFLAPRYMRVYVTPVRRMTVTGSQSTQGKRTVGNKGLRMEAVIVRANR